MKTPKNEKKKWSAPKVIDLDVKKTNSGVSTFLTETSWTSTCPYAYAPSS